MMEKFYCVGCKKHHELEVLEATEQNGKGGSIRYSLRSVCPSGHKTNKLCKREIYEAYGAEVSELAAEVSGMTVGVNLEALAPTADEPDTGVALVPEDSLMPEGSGRTIGSQSVSHNYTPFHAEMDDDGNYSFCPKCGYEPPVYEVGQEMEDGSIIETEQEAHEETIFWLYENHPDYCPAGWNPDDDEQDQSRFDAETVGVCDYCSYLQSYAPSNMLLIADNPRLAHDYCKACDSHHPDYEPTDKCEDFRPRNPDVYEGNIWFCQGCGSGTDMVVPLSEANKYMGAETEVHDAETFIVYPELKNHLVAIMPDKVYGVTALDDGDFEMSVANRYMDEVIAAVSEYQMNEESAEPSGFLGSGFSKTTVAVATATLAVGLAYYFNRK